MKIAFISSFYYKHCLQIYKKHKYLDERSYIEQEKTIEKEAICSMGQWPYYFKDVGWEVMMVCRNNPFIQKTWCEENDFYPSSDDTEFEIITEQVKRFKPEILFVFGASYFEVNFRLEKLIRNTPSIRNKICWYGAPEGEDEKKLKKYDLVLTNSFKLRDSLRKKRINSQQLNHAFEPLTLKYIKKRKKKNKICFFGSVVPGHNWHNERIKYLNEISEICEIDIFSDRNELNFLQRIKSNYITSRHSICKSLSSFGFSNSYVNHYKRVDIIPKYNGVEGIELSSKCHNPLYGIDMFQKLSEYILSFNIHINHTGDDACNMRLFESGGVGTALLTDYKKNISNIYNVNRDILTFKSINDLQKQIKKYIKDKDFLLELARNAQESILKFNTTEIQFERLFTLLKGIL